MYIKKVIIEGPFSPKVNVVVGANGSGKSNFFHAIRSVLSDTFQNPQSEDRGALLHECSGHLVVSAFVEIVFDNTDNRIPVDKEEVRLRRTIASKDGYYLDGKHVSKTQVMNLLESAGFSRSNPYYIVQQGKIASLTLMKDSERLDLLKGIGGTRVYEDRRNESLKIMNLTANKRKQIDQFVHYLEERLRELDEEKEELKKYQQLDKQRRSLEYTRVLHHELNDARNELAMTSHCYALFLSLIYINISLIASADLHKHIRCITIFPFLYAVFSCGRSLEKNSESMFLVDNEVVEVHEMIKSFDKQVKAQKEGVEKSRTEALELVAQIELDLRDMKDRIVIEKRAKDEAVMDLEFVKWESEKSKSELAEISKLHQAKLNEKRRYQRGEIIMDREKQLSILYQKQGRATQFANKAARDNWLQNEIKDLEPVLSSNRKQEGLVQEEFLKLKDEINNLTNYIESQKSTSKLEAELARGQNDYNDLMKQRDVLQEQRKSFWKEESDVTDEIDRLREDLIKAQKSLDRAMPGDIRRGLNFVSRIIKDHRIKGVFGPVLELIDCEEKFFRAVENDDISTKIIQILTREKEGRVTFIPLNRVKVPDLSCPQSPDFVPLMKKLKYHADYHRAFEQMADLQLVCLYVPSDAPRSVLCPQQPACQPHAQPNWFFGRTVICRDLETATKVARNNGRDCIKLDGGMTGGFYDSRCSKLKFVKIIRDKKTAFEKKMAHLEIVGNKLKDILLCPKECENKATVCPIFTAYLQGQYFVVSYLAVHYTKITDLVTKQQQMDAKHDHAEPELEQFKGDIGSAMKRRVSLEKALGKKEQTLDNIRNQIEQIQSSIAMKNYEMGTELIDQLTSEERDLLSRLNPEITELKERLRLCKNSHIEIIILWKANVDAINNFNKKMDNLKRKRDDLKDHSSSQKIRDLGLLPDDSFEAYKTRNRKQLQKMLYDCNEQLQQFSHVNQKALDQYVNFTEQREQLQRRRAELDAGNQKIMELILLLDQRKDESIQRTFKGVARHFREVFSELVQGGHGYLDGDACGDDNDDDVPSNPNPEGRIEKYIGAKVKAISFTGKGETLSMKQLSGGQKTLVALTLIFAIQRCDPAPFYLFDEIDAALDPQYRTAVGNMIRRLADMANTQFIVTTFRPEIVKVTDKLYGVTHKNRVSYINVVS
ncbi:hypothetical protein BS78_K254900 [Paspalum vaginatum]|uniref:SMC hinge domain-containing protein n=1 Tax=Paspalum vaginatum TaxID=158149 RepID=A0A9W7XB31_9POAL|nr:hypothetical protein BS78_K254900 [Paspalum vaginatum]